MLHNKTPDRSMFEPICNTFLTDRLLVSEALQVLFRFVPEKKTFEKRMKPLQK